jgi:RNA polymerase sigma-70 factor (ECF subfamily)
MLDPEPGGTACGVLPLAVVRASVGRARPADDPSAIDALVARAYEAHAGELFGFLLRVTRDAGVAEEISQETFLRLCRELRASPPPDNLRAWLYRVAANLAVSRGRHLTVVRRCLAAISPGEETFEAPERTALRLERHELLRAALDVLPRDQRVGLLMAAQGFTGHEISQALGRSDVSTRTMLCRARLRLRGLLEPDEER